ncbi:MerR family transcriptional regulator [Umezawaea endophytica]|uniref:MerR family transcriptional regulator n=1 Tax=Umezawaea endophytica TaxID=1654476 RepID=A0A9X2VMK0_9PSEU|nr:MerR family transcriptional regulator [Umezawaea endophytica]MCS7479262.1 MerR family transcriptional regulator [Umezawaea endophytica]
MGKLVTTSEAAKELGVGTSTLQRWAKDKVVSPDLVTPGGHMRWDVDNLRDQLRELRQRDE